MVLYRKNFLEFQENEFHNLEQHMPVYYTQLPNQRQKTEESSPILEPIALFLTMQLSTYVCLGIMEKHCLAFTAFCLTSPKELHKSMTQSYVYIKGNSQEHKI